MQGTLSASQDQDQLGADSYIVAAAIMTAPVGWVANRFGRKRIFIICSGGFTIASVLCGWRRTLTRWCCFVCCRACSARRWCRCRKAVMLDSYGAARARQGDGDLGHGRDDGPDHGTSLAPG